MENEKYGHLSNEMLLEQFKQSDMDHEMWKELFDRFLNTVEKICKPSFPEPAREDFQEFETEEQNEAAYKRAVRNAINKFERFRDALSDRLKIHAYYEDEVKNLGAWFEMRTAHYCKYPYAVDDENMELCLFYYFTKKEKYYTQLYNINLEMTIQACMKYVKLRKFAEEVANDVWLILNKLLLEMKIDRNFHALLRLRVKWECLKFLRGRGGDISAQSIIEDEIEDEDRNEISENEIKLLQSMDAYNDCFNNALSAKQQQAFWWFYIERKSYNEIMTLMEIAWDEVRSHVWNGMRNMRNCMEKKLFTEQKWRIKLIEEAKLKDLTHILDLLTERSPLLKDCLKKLGYDDKNHPVHLKWYVGKLYSEIAKQIGAGSDQVFKILKKGLENLKNCLAKNDEESI